MNGIEIQYLLGLYFVIVSLSRVEGKLAADFVRLIAGVILIALAVLKVTFI